MAITRELHLAGCLLWAGVLGACASPTSSPPPRTTAAPSGAPPTDLAYDRVVQGNKDLYVAPADGGPERRLTDDPAEDVLPRWTRDGRTVLFSSQRSGNWQLWDVPASGGAPRRLRSNSWTEWQADLSPDGRVLAFLSNRDGPESLWLADTVEGKERVLVRHGRRSILGNPHWSPDSRQIVFSSNWSVGHEIFVVDTVTGAQRRLSGLLSGGCEPRFSPDGTHVVHVTRGHHLPTSRVVETDLPTGAEKVLVAWPALNYDPVYSPDGSEIAFASDITGDNQIFRLRLSDGQTWRVTSGPGPARNPDYRPRR